MKVLIFGAGAIGSAVAALLARDHRVTAVGRLAHVRAIRENGLRMVGGRDMVVRDLRAVADIQEVPPQDLVFITTKAYDTAAACRAVAGVADGATVVSLQNGLGNIDVVSEAFGPRAAVGLTSIGVTMLGPGEIRWAGEGDTVLGSPSGMTGRAEEAARVLSEAGLPSRVSNDIRSEVWMKAVVNAAVNPVTALVGKENGCILGSADLRRVCEAACREAKEAAISNGIDLPAQGKELVASVLRVVERTGSNRSSMLQDLERGKRTEIDEITGALVEKGEARGVSMPVNRALWALVRNAARR